jgi:hypothetical protein
MKSFSLIRFTGSILVWGVLLMIVQGCKKDFDPDRIKALDWNPELAIPLVKDSITFEKALIETDQEKNFYIDESGEVSILLYFNNKAFKLKPSDLLTLPPFDLTYQKEITAAEQQILSIQDLPIPVTSYSINLSSGNPGIEINKILVKKGYLLITSTMTFDNEGFLKVNFPEATKNGTALMINLGAFIRGTQTDTVDLQGVFIDLNAHPNQMTAEISGLLRKNPEPVAGDVIRTDFQIVIGEIGKFEGYLGQLTFSPPEEAVKVTAFNNAYVLGNLWFEDPRVTITTMNSIGIPALVTIEKLWGWNNGSNVTLDITERLGSNASIPIPSPDFLSQKPVITSMTYTNGNTGNSMHDLFNLKPDKVWFKVKAEVNPNGKTFNFFTDTSSFYADLKVQLPLFGHFDHLTLQDTFDFSINKQKEIESILFKLKVTNGLPLTAAMQVYFTDSVYNVMDSLTGTDKIIIREAPVDPTTFLPYPGQFGVKDTTFYVGPERMDRLTGAQKILVRAVMNSAQNGIPNVKIKAHQALDLDFRALVRIKDKIEL